MAVKHGRALGSGRLRSRLLQWMGGFRLCVACNPVRRRLGLIPKGRPIGFSLAVACWLVLGVHGRAHAAVTAYGAC